MNAKIKEIMEESGLYIDSHDKEITEKEICFFAELLIEKCLQVINQPNGVGDDDVIRISRDVKQYFGVK